MPESFLAIVRHHDSHSPEPGFSPGDVRRFMLRAAAVQPATRTPDPARTSVRSNREARGFPQTLCSCALGGASSICVSTKPCGARTVRRCDRPCRCHGNAPISGVCRGSAGRAARAEEPGRRRRARRSARGRTFVASSLRRPAGQPPSSGAQPPTSEAFSRTVLSIMQARRRLVPRASRSR